MGVGGRRWLSSRASAMSFWCVAGVVQFGSAWVGGWLCGVVGVTIIVKKGGGVGVWGDCDGVGCVWQEWRKKDGGQSRVGCGLFNCW